jgi:hypothetical protein
MRNKFDAKYRGKVVDNKDPNGLGRIKVHVPSVLGDVTDSWAMPASPYAGPGVGWFAIPPVDANVWVEFEGGDHTLPIWTGGYWTTKDDMPLSPAGPDTKLFRTEGIFVAHNNSEDSVKVGDVSIDKGFTIYVNKPILDSGYLKLFMGVDGLIKIDNNGEETITMNKEKIEINKEDSSIVKLTKTVIDSTTGTTEVKMEADPDKITIKNAGSTVVLSQQGIDSTVAAADIKMTQDSIVVSFGPGSVTLNAGGITITYSGATVALTPATVTVNDGALQVI